MIIYLKGIECKRFIMTDFVLSQNPAIKHVPLRNVGYGFLIEPLPSANRQIS